MKTSAPFGTWQSDLSAQIVASGSPRLAEPQLTEHRLFWLEGRPSENGRTALVCKFKGIIEDVLPQPWSARSKVHEYGGGSYIATDNDVYFVNASCQQVYHLNLKTGATIELTNTPQCRYGGLTLDRKRERLIAICEQHSGGEPKNTIVSIDCHHGTFDPEVLAEGCDFYAHPTLSPCGQFLAFVCWNHPNMPWDNSQLYYAALNEQGKLEAPIPITSGSSSVFQPQWLNSEYLLFVDDANEWWNIYSYDLAAGKTKPLYATDAEFATPLWTLNMSTYGVIDENNLFVSYTRNGQWHSGILHEEDLQRWHLQPIDTPLVHIQDVHVFEHQAVCIGAGAKTSPDVWHWQKSSFKPLYNNPPELNDQGISVGVPFTFPTADNDTCFANYYAPTNQYFEGNEGTSPPAIFIGHGGPTGQTNLGYSAKVQFWTNRGFAVIDVNYRGSTGFGRPYREKLIGQWGVKDVQDMCCAANYAAAQKWVAADHCAIRGGSAGGYTVLAALTDSDTFNAGVSLYGIGDLETLARDTHKFEARYLDSLIGPYPEQQALYQQRSPIHKADQISCPILVFQGLDDKVVPPNQAEEMVNAVKKQGLPVVYVTYAGEAHGFRKADTVINQLQTELRFYKDVFGL